MEKRFCKKCGKLLSKNCKGEYCNIHRDRTGANNPFFGKKHSEETKKKLIKSCSEASKKLWENDEYRKKVIGNATGIKRSDEFKEKQRLNAILQFQDEEQRKLRSNSMKESWKKGLITSTEHLSTNSSKQEKEDKFQEGRGRRSHGRSCKRTSFQPLERKVIIPSSYKEKNNGRKERNKSA